MAAQIQEAPLPPSPPPQITLALEEPDDNPLERVLRLILAPGQKLAETIKE